MRLATGDSAKHELSTFEKAATNDTPLTMKTVLGMRRLVSRVPAQNTYRPSSSTRTSHPLSARSYSVALPPRKAATTYTFPQSRSRSKSRGNISGLTPCTAFQRNSSTTRQQESPPSSSTSSSPPRPLTDRADTPEAAPTQRDVPAYELTFTCKPCLTRSTHRISKHGYEKGTVLITCPNCKNRHVISDHLGVSHFLLDSYGLKKAGHGFWMRLLYYDC